MSDPLPITKSLSLQCLTLIIKCNSFILSWNVNFILIFKFQLQVDKNCNATPIAQQPTQQTGPPCSSVNQNVSVSSTNAIRQTLDQPNPPLHYINMQKPNHGSANKQQSAGNWLNKCDKKANNEANQNEASPVKRRSASQMDVRTNCFCEKTSILFYSPK